MWPRKRSKTASRRPQELPRGLRTPSRALQGASRRLQEHSKTLQDGSKSAQEASRRPQERSKRRQDGAKSVPRGLETPQERSTWLKTAPRALQEASRRLMRSNSASLQVCVQDNVRRRCSKKRSKQLFVSTQLYWAGCGPTGSVHIMHGFTLVCIYPPAPLVGAARLRGFLVCT